MARLLEVACDPRHPEGTRAMSAAEIGDLAPALTEEQAATAADALLPLALGEYGRSRWDENLDHPFGDLKIRLHTPGTLRAAAIEALGRLAAEHGAAA